VTDPVELARSAANPREPMQGLRALVALRHELVELEARHVAEGLREGRSWSQIAEALGVSKQAAHKRHAARVREARPDPTAPPQRRLLVTGQARRVVELARAEARAAGRPEVGPEHLLLGLLADDHGTALRALEAAGVELATARESLYAVSRDAGRADGARGRIRVSREARAALEESLRQAVRLGDSHLGVEHLLLALLHDRDAPAARLLTELGAPPEQVTHWVHQLVGAPG
jgi:hypothetical protein